MPIGKRAAAEFIGTFWLVFGGCGSAVLAAAFPQVGIGLHGVSLAFGLTVLTMAYAIGHISGCHLNPAVSIGLYTGGRFPASELLPYIVAQVLGAIVGAFVLYLIASGKADFSLSGGFASNGYGARFSRGLLSVRRIRSRISFNIYVLADYSRSHRRACAAGLCSYCHWTGADVDSPDQYSGHQYLCEPGTEHGSSDLCRRLGARTAVALLGSPAPWGSWSRGCL